ncbi:MAG TPA: SMI1/KNR4 family protein [Verrucomicrobiae bacterium]|nr:SMI1/KNR4 family protein [Verrucomicrobiae bacterium]
MTRSEELLEKASEIPISPVRPNKTFFAEGPVEQELFRLLSRKNGFYAFESALHVFPSNVRHGMDLEDWNASGLWRYEYGKLADGILFFAEDIFGGQFCIKNSAVWLFDPETGNCNKIAPDLEGWADCVLTDYNYLTGYPMAHLWQQKMGVIPNDHRLVPKIPFVAGGRYDLSNLRLMPSVDGMKWRGHIARQIKNLPDGAKVTFEVVNGD